MTSILFNYFYTFWKSHTLWIISKSRAQIEKILHKQKIHERKFYIHWPNFCKISSQTKKVFFSKKSSIKKKTFSTMLCRLLYMLSYSNKGKHEISGIRSVLISIFVTKLSNRLQSVQIDREKSSSFPITCDVPQGSILAPLRLFIYINDLNSCTKDMEFFHFTNHSTKYAKVK